MQGSVGCASRSTSTAAIAVNSAAPELEEHARYAAQFNTGRADSGAVRSDSVTRTVLDFQ